MFVEIVRAERRDSADDSSSHPSELSIQLSDTYLNFRRKGRPFDGHAFFCLCRTGYSEALDALFERLSTSTKALKLFAVQSDAFHHTGALVCGFCTVQRSVGGAKLKNIKSNVEYAVAIALHAARWSKIGGLSLPSSVCAASDDAGAFVSIDSSHVNATATSAACAASQLPKNEGAIPAPQLGDDVVPFVDRVQLRELREQSSKLHPAFRIIGRSPWYDNLLPSLECVRSVAWQCQSFFKKHTLHFHRRRDANGAIIVESTSTSLIDRQLVVHGVADPLCGLLVSLILSLSDTVRAYHGVGKQRQQEGKEGHHSKRRIEPADSRHHSPPTARGGAPPGPPPTAGDILDAMSVLGTRTITASLSASWTIDWYDILLLCTCDVPGLRRVMQLATQWKSFDIDGQPLSARLNWMLRPEKRSVPAGSMLQLMVSESTRLGIEAEASSSLCPDKRCPMSPARAIWAFLSHRQQLRAMYYVTPWETLDHAASMVRKEMLSPAVVQPLARSIRRSLVRRRLRDWLRFTLEARRRREFLRMRTASRSMSVCSSGVATLLDALVERADIKIMQHFMAQWLKHRVLVKFVVPMLARNQWLHMQSRFRCWRIAAMRQFNIRIPRSLTLAARGVQDLSPSPKAWIRCVRRLAISDAADSAAVFPVHSPPLFATQRRLPASPSVHLSVPATAKAYTVFYQLSDVGGVKSVTVVEERLPLCATSGAPTAILTCSSRLKRYFLLNEVQRARETSFVFRVWRRFAEISSQYRCQQERQLRAVMNLFDGHRGGSSDHTVMRVIFAGWKRFAISRQHARLVRCADDSGL